MTNNQREYERIIRKIFRNTGIDISDLKPARITKKQMQVIKYINKYTSNAVSETQIRRAYKDLQSISAERIKKIQKKQTTRASDTDPYDIHKVKRRYGNPDNFMGGQRFGNRKGNPQNLVHKGNPNNLVHKGNPENLVHKGNPKNLQHKGNPANLQHKGNEANLNRQGRKQGAKDKQPRKKPEKAQSPFPQAWQLEMTKINDIIANIRDKNGYTASLLDKWIGNLIDKFGLERAYQMIWEVENNHQYSFDVMYNRYHYDEVRAFITGFMYYAIKDGIMDEWDASAILNSLDQITRFTDVFGGTIQNFKDYFEIMLDDPYVTDSETAIDSILVNGNLEIF